MMVSVGRAYGALGSAAEVVAPACGTVVLAEVFFEGRHGGEAEGVPSDRRLDSGTEPVSSTVNIPSVMSVKPSVREK